LINENRAELFGIPKWVSVGLVIVTRVQSLSLKKLHLSMHDLELLFRGVQHDDVRSIIIPENLEVVISHHGETRWNPFSLTRNVTLSQAVLLDVIFDFHQSLTSNESCAVDAKKLSARQRRGQTQSCATVVRRLGILAARSDLYGVVCSDYFNSASLGFEPR
jgi:hypothetical protein